MYVYYIIFKEKFKRKSDILLQKFVNFTEIVKQYLSVVEFSLNSFSSNNSKINKHNRIAVSLYDHRF